MILEMLWFSILINYFVNNFNNIEILWSTMKSSHLHVDTKLDITCDPLHQLIINAVQASDSTAIVRNKFEPIASNNML